MTTSLVGRPRTKRSPGPRLKGSWWWRGTKSRWPLACADRWERRGRAGLCAREGGSGKMGAGLCWCVTAAPLLLSLPSVQVIIWSLTVRRGK